MARRFDNFEYRTLADRSQGERVTKYDPDTGAPYLVNPETGEPEPWPIAGYDWAFPESVPKRVKFPTKLAVRAQMEGWAELVNPKMVYRNGGPAEDPQRVLHSFVHADEIVFHFESGDYRYKVVEQPDKYASSESDEPGEAGSQEAAVYWSYHLVRADD